MPNVASLLLGFAMFANMLITTQQLQLPTATGYGFADLKLLNVMLDPSGQLVAAPGQWVIRSGLLGVPNVDLVRRLLRRCTCGAS